ncbi:CHAT domain-containing protein [Kitasatospora sp. NPDC101235]|uniref:CHAT domain-containing protein n=1 Tax=Kitasatospora sp. NPDC101235 TaxID=3364101 RepID=UPI00381CA5EE
MDRRRGLSSGERVLGLLLGLGKGRLDGTDLGRRAHEALRVWEKDPQDVQALQRATVMYGEALRSIPADHPQRVGLIEQLAGCHRNLWIARGDLDDLRVGLELMADCARLTPAHDAEEWAGRRWATMVLHVLRYGVTKSSEDLGGAEAWRRELAPLLSGPYRHPWEAGIRAAVCLTDAQLAAVRGDAAACAELAGQARQILGGPVLPAGGWAVETWGVLLRRRTLFQLSAYEDTYDEPAYVEALALASCGIDAFGVGPGLPAALLRFRGRLRAVHYRLHRRSDAALLARRDFEAALGLAEPSPGEPRARTQWRLAHLLLLRSHYGALDAADTATLHETAAAALAGTAPGTPEHADCLHLAAELRRVAGADGSPEHLREAVRMYEQVLPALQHTGIGWEVHNRLSIVLRDLHRATGDPGHLDAAIGHAERSLTLCPERDAPHTAPLLHTTLGELHRLRYEWSVHHDDYDRALHHSRQALELSPYPGAAPQWALRVSNHAIVVALAGGAASLRRAEDLLRDALSRDDLPPSERTLLHHNLGTIMREAAEATRDRDLLRDAILNLRLADAAAAEDGGLPEARRNLALALHAQWELDRQPGPLDESHDLLRSALANSSAGTPLRPLVLSDLGTVLIARAAHRLGPDRPATVTGQAAGAWAPSSGPDPSAVALARDDLERAADLLAEALDEPAGGAAARALIATQYGEALADLGWLTGRPGLVEESLAPQREAVRALDEAGPHWFAPALFLADSLIRQDDPSAEDRREAADLYRRITRHPLTAPASRWRAAVARARLLTDARDWTGALDAYTTAIAALPQLAWGGLDFDDRLDALSDTSQTVSDAAATALQAGAPERALEILEHGRGLLLAYALDMRADLETVRERSPRLAAELALLRDERPPRHGPAGVHRRRRQRTWDRLVEQVRQVPGLEGFLHPPPYHKLLGAARQGPVVVLNSSTLRADALVLHEGRLTVVPLPRFRHRKAVLRAEALATLIHRTGTGAGPAAEARERRDYLTDLLDWLWATVAEPLLPVLAPAARRGRQHATAPRLWWCPTGVFNRLPVHAATRLPDPDTPHDQGTDSLADRFVTSHTPTLRALATAREEAGRAASRTASPALLVGVGETPPGTDLPPLRHVPLEIDDVARLLPTARGLRDKDAHRDAVVRHLSAGGWLHFAGHAEQDAVNPDGVLYLWESDRSRSLRIRDIAGLRLEQADLAYLSACQTHRAPPAHSDEPVSLAGALQLAGYRHVVASLWQLNSNRARQVATDFYTTLLLTPDGRTGASTPEAAAGSAHALHAAVSRLRGMRPEAVDLWAAYVHIGP